MEELTESLATSFQVSNIPNSTAAPHPRLLQYKLKSSAVDQEERRRRKLEQQKQKRVDYINHVRRLAEDDWKDYTSEDEEDDDEMDTSISKKKQKKKKARYYSNQLMLSEWLVDMPVNFAEDWKMMLCPVGKRSLIVASHGTTTAYSKSGYKMNRFPSLLPGGNRRGIHKNTEYTLLDCIYSEVNRTFYMLDVMCWRGVPVYDSDTEFRFYWMHTKFEDVPGLATHSNINPYKIIPLPYCSCKTEYIEKTMASPLPFEVQLDGILFYHKETHYTPGSTPLVGWLKPWMLPEILDVKVPKCYIESRPANSSLLPPSPSMDVTAPQSAAGDSTEKLLSSPVMDIAAPRSNVGDSIEKLLLSPAMDIAAPQSAAGDSTEKLLSSPVMVVTAPLTVVGDSNNAKTDLNEQNLSID